MRPTVLVALGIAGGALLTLPQPAATQSLIQQDTHDCHIAIYTTMESYDKVEGKEKVYRRYWDGLSKLGKATGVYTYNTDDLPVYVARKQVMLAKIPPPKLAKLADTCIAALNRDNYRTINPFAAELDTPEFLAIRSRIRGEEAQERARQQQAQSSYQAQSAPVSRPAPQVDPREAQCRAIMDQGVASSTKDMMQARKWVEAWLKMGAGGTVMGGDYVRSGCNTINSTINRLNAQQCHPDYANALVKFRNGYYIGLPNGGTLQCS